MSRYSVSINGHPLDQYSLYLQTFTLNVSRLSFTYRHISHGTIGMFHYHQLFQYFCSNEHINECRALFSQSILHIALHNAFEEHMWVTVKSSVSKATIHVYQQCPSELHWSGDSSTLLRETPHNTHKTSCLPSPSRQI